jgi:hypothetical protein
MTKASIPILGNASFRCAHCGAIAHQNWYRLRAIRSDKENPPRVISEEMINEVAAREEDDEKMNRLLAFGAKIRSGNVFFEVGEWESCNLRVFNLWLSRCFSCDEISVWVNERMLFPDHEYVLEPNVDLPDEIKRDFIEAAKILELSPRGSAALLRLCIQKLCKHLGKSGENVNRDIASLVKDGLDARIQKSLDIVRVVGNSAVHPGMIDLTDDRDTASKLFRLVNIIADVMITQPRHIDELYEDLPETSKQQIKNRDAPRT